MLILLQRESIHFDTTPHMAIRLAQVGVRRWNAGFWIAVLCSVGCGKPETARPATAVRRDAVLITIDTLRADRVGVIGGSSDVTPSIDALGRAGAVFLDATAHAPLTLPSHASILTGLYPVTHGVHDNSGFT